MITQVVKYSLLVHRNNGSTKAPHCYVIRTLPVLSDLTAVITARQMESGLEPQNNFNCKFSTSSRCDRTSMVAIFFVLGWYVLPTCTICKCPLSSDFADLCPMSTVTLALSGSLFCWRAWTAKKESGLNLTEFNFSDWIYPLQTQSASVHKVFHSQPGSFLYRFKTKPHMKYPLCSNLRFRSSTPERALSSLHSRCHLQKLQY